MSKSNKREQPQDLFVALEEISVLYPGAWENDTGPKDWWAVATEDGIVAYFGDEDHANFFRLALLNARLNPIK